MFFRLPSALTTGCFVTLGLFYLMHTLITLQPGTAVEPRDRHRLDWIHLDPEEELLLDEPQSIDKSFVTPPVVPPGRTDGGDERITVGVITPVTPPGDPAVAIDALGFADGPLVAVWRVKPVYPAKAATLGLEGHVIVRFDVLADGSVANAAVVESSHKLFNPAAIKAAEKSRFKPRVVDGVPQRTDGVQSLYRFNLEE